MNDLLFYALLMALLYYFFIYLPSQKKLSNQTPTSPSPIFATKQTQTETIISNEEPGMVNFPEDQIIPDPQALQKLTQENKELEKDNQQKEQTIIGLNNSYDKLETKKKQELENLHQQLATEKALEKHLDTLIKNIQDLNKELD